MSVLYRSKEGVQIIFDINGTVQLSDKWPREKPITVTLDELNEIITLYKEHFKERIEWIKKQKLEK